MAQYRCYILDGADRIALMHPFHSDDELAAVDRARAMLREDPRFAGVELWRLDRRVYASGAERIAAAGA
jgi:hypothetical protein